MASKQNQNPKETSLATTQKDQTTSKTDQAKLIPMDYLSLVLILASLFDDPDGKQIADFWNEYRKVFREIFSDFPEFDISEDTVKKILMTTKSWNLVGLDSHYYWLEPLFDLIKDSIPSGEKTITQPLNVRRGIYAYYCLFETPIGTALGHKLTGRRKPSHWEGRLLKAFINISNTVVTWNVKGPEPTHLSELIDFYADFFLPVNSTKSSIYKEILTSFEKYKNGVKEVSEIIENEHGVEYERSIHVIPTIYLSKEIKGNWQGLKDGCLIKATFKKSKIVKGQNVYFISSLPFELSNIEELAARAIWHYWEIKDKLYEIMEIDCHLDERGGKNATYINNCEYLKVFSNRVLTSLSDECINYLNKVSDKQKHYNKKKYIIDLIKEIATYYEKEQEEQLEKELEYYERNDWYF